jgi:hypothetical protein
MTARKPSSQKIQYSLAEENEIRPTRRQTNLRFPYDAAIQAFSPGLAPPPKKNCPKKFEYCFVNRKSSLSTKTEKKYFRLFKNVQEKAK